MKIVFRRKAIVVSREESLNLRDTFRLYGSFGANNRALFWGRRIDVTSAADGQIDNFQDLQ